MEKTVSEAIAYRRSVRVFRPDVSLDDQKVKACISNAVLAPTSSNLQLWEFYHITNPEVRKQMTEACLEQNAAKTAQQLVVVVARKDLWRMRAKANIAFLKSQYGTKERADYTKREKFALNYYEKLIPSIYIDFLGILGALKYVDFPRDRPVQTYLPTSAQLRYAHCCPQERRVGRTKFYDQYGCHWL